MGYSLPFQFLIGNVLAIEFKRGYFVVDGKFQFLIGNVLAFTPCDSMSFAGIVSIPYSQCLSSR